MTSWQSLRLPGPSLCLSMKRRKAPSQTLCQTVQEMKEGRMGNVFFSFSLPNNFTPSSLSPGRRWCDGQFHMASYSTPMSKQNTIAEVLRFLFSCLWKKSEIFIKTFYTYVVFWIHVSFSIPCLKHPYNSELN